MAGVTEQPNFQRSVAQYPNIKTGEEFTGYA